MCIIIVILKVRFSLFLLVPLSLNNQIIRLLSDLGNEIAVFESLQNRMSKPVLWHAPEDAYLNVFDSELIQEQQARYLNV
jgi:hypothetical protein